MNDFLKDVIKETGNEYAGIVSEGVEAGDVDNFIDTGSYVFNALVSGSLYGGLPQNKITALAGESATGKTFFLMGMVKNFLDQNENGGVVYFESESAITKQMVIDRGIDADRMVIVPVTTVLVCMIIQLHWLRKPTPSNASAQNQRHVTVTIMLLTGIFFVCNVPYTVMMVSFYIIRIILLAGELSSSFYIIRAMTCTTLPLINAVVNPAILINRCAALKASMLNIMRWCLRVVSTAVQRRPGDNEAAMPPAANAIVAEADLSGVAANALAVAQM